MLHLMADLFKLIWLAIIGLFRSRASLEAEILALRYQLNVLRRRAPKRIAVTVFDRLIFASLYRIAPGVLNALVTSCRPAMTKLEQFHRGFVSVGKCTSFARTAAQTNRRLDQPANPKATNPSAGRPTGATTMTGGRS
jgi:hypothetical protein